ncbi:MAG: protein senC [Rhodobacteraceae bacterium]|nr:MAG: protein senC [Paracoccaceae bacterium]
MTKKYSILAAILVACALVAGIYFAFLKPHDDCAPAGVVAGDATIGGAFALVDHMGQAVTDKDVITDLTLIYFGYTFCPDVCPLDMMRNIEAVDILKAQGVTVKPVFITIDPARDTPQALSDYVDVMHPDLLALTGTQEQVSAASKVYRTFFQKNGEGDDYLMDHSTLTYLMSPDGFVDFIRRSMSPEETAEKIACYAK